MSYARVLLDLPLPHALEYRLTPEQQAVARVGMRCVAPVGPRRLMLGVVVGLTPQPSIDEQRVRPVRALLADPMLEHDWLQFCKFAADYYHHGWAEVVLAALPPLLRQVPGPRAKSRLAHLRRFGIVEPEGDRRLSMGGGYQHRRGGKKRQSAPKHGVLPACFCCVSRVADSIVQPKATSKHIDHARAVASTP